MSSSRRHPTSQRHVTNLHSRIQRCGRRVDWEPGKATLTLCGREWKHQGLDMGVDAGGANLAGDPVGRRTWHWLADNLANGCCACINGWMC